MHDYANLRAQLIKLINQNRMREAEELAEEHLMEEARNPDFLYIFGLILCHQFKFKSALKFLRDAANLAPVQDVIFKLSETLYKAGELDEARDRIDQLLIQFPEELKYVELKGKIIGRAESLVGCRLELLDIHPDIYEQQRADSARKYIPVYSARNEQRIIRQYLNHVKDLNPFLVDIGAGDGMTFSNSLGLLEESNWRALLIEGSHVAGKDLLQIIPKITTRAKIALAYVVPQRIVGMLESFDVPTDFGFLTLDVDSIEYPILEAILTKFRPRLICVEINERIHPSVEYFKTYSANESYRNAPLFLGAGIASLFNLLTQHEYIPFHLEYNNLFAAPREDQGTIEICHYPQDQTASELYESGFLNRGDTYSIYPWNKPFASLISLNKDDFCHRWRELIRESNLKFKYYLNGKFFD
jgi:hypothetical protein